MALHHKCQCVATVVNSCVLLVVAISVGAQDPTVVLRQGTLRGIKIYTETRISVTAFLGIPFAMPPVGNLRFAAPERHEGWDRSLYANAFAPSCPQPQQQLAPNIAVITQQDEDCLYLNVWTTELAMSYRNVPVIVFLEGEGFVTSSPARFPAQDLAAEGLIVVSVNYRTNVFGFLCLEDGEVRGNLGLLDQYLALLWVRENIALFGGDPRSVTLMGHSAGAASVMYHLISPRTAGLFNRAIIMSGSVTSPWSRTEHPSNASRAIARSLGCLATNETLQILTCLRTKSTSEILRAYETQYMKGNWSELPLPVVDSFLPDIEQYLPRDPVTVLREGSYLKVPVLTGVASHEGAASLAEWSDLVQQGFTQLRHLVVGSLIPSVMSRYELTGLDSSRHIAAVLEWQYVDSVRHGDTMALLEQLLHFYSDAQFKAPHELQLKLLAERPESSNVVYAYEFEQTGVDVYANNFNFSGTGHGTELLYLFGPTLMQQIAGRRFTSSEDRLSTAMKRLWAEFIRQGNLSPTPYGYGATWRRYSVEDDNFVVLKTENALPAQQPVLRIPSPLQKLAKQRTSLWNQLMPRLRNITTPITATPASTGMHLTTDSPYRSAMYTLIGFVVVLLILLIVCVVLLKRRAKERERELF